MLEMRTILCPTDLSEPALAAFRMACALARDRGARVVVLHAYPTPANRADALDRARDPNFEADLVETLRAHAGQHLGVVVDYRVEEGDPVECILRSARGCDVLVMGTHGWTGIRRAMLGSVTEEVLRKAPCPVVAVRPESRIPAESPREPEPAGAGSAELGAGD
jgi:nucleotide-binding universal stress UspA family protein